MHTQVFEPDYESDRVPPSVKELRPCIVKQGHTWVAETGNSGEGIRGLGSSPEEAMRDFDRAFAREKENSTG